MAWLRSIETRSKPTVDRYKGVKSSVAIAILLSSDNHGITGTGLPNGPPNKRFRRQQPGFKRCTDCADVQSRSYDEPQTIKLQALASCRRVRSAQSSQVRIRASGSGCVKKSVMTAADWAPASITLGARSGVMPPIATSGSDPI